jgi:hypothetical protein
MALLGSVKFLVVGAVGAVLLLFAKLDRFGQNAALVFTAAGLGIGTYKILRALRVPDDAIIPTIDDLPQPERIRALRRLRLILAVAITLLSAWTAYDLYQLESGTVDHVFSFGPSVLLYEWLGFWPAVCFLPAVGLLGVWSISRQLGTLSRAKVA